MLTIKPLPGTFTVCQPLDTASIPWDQPFVFAAKTDKELSLVCPTASTPATTQREDGWQGMRIEGVLDFSLVGILAPIATLLAEQKIPIFALSTYETDYIFVKQEQFETALQALSREGYDVQ